MKKLAVTINDEDLIKVLSVLVKCGADFTVETVGTEPEPLRRTRQNKDESGRSCAEVVLDKIVSANGRRISINEIHAASRAAGFAGTTSYNALNSLETKGLINRDGNWVKATPETA